MKKLYENETIKEEEFDDIDEISGLEFIDCKILKCNWYEKKITNCIFSNCQFSDVNLAMCKLYETQLNNVKFENCKLIGVNFSYCHKFLFEVNFVNCILDFASFENMKIPNTQFVDCSMKGIDLAGANLEKSRFINVNFEDAIFAKTNLKNTDFSTAYNFAINPTQNYLRNAMFSESNLSGLLHEFGIQII